MHKTAVVILNYNGISFLKKFLPTTIRYSVSSEVIPVVADNGSTDGSAEWIESNFPMVKLIKLPENYGFAGGYNRALDQVDAQYYILLNSDVEVTEGWLENMTEFLDRNPDAAAVQPKIMAYNNREHFEYAGASGGYIDRYGYPFCRGRIFGKIERDTGQYDDITEIFWSTGACMMIRSSVWRECGGFDGDFFAHMEEVDLCWRIRSAGHRVFVIPRSTVFHIGGGQLPYGSSFKTYLNFRNSLYLLYKNLPGERLRLTLMYRFLLDGTALVYFAIQLKLSHAAAIVKAYCSYYGNLDELKTKREKIRKLPAKDLIKEGVVLNKCLVFEFYFRRKRTFSVLSGFMKK